MSKETKELKARVRNLEFAVLAIASIIGEHDIDKEMLGRVMGDFLNTNKNLQSLFSFEKLKG